MSTIKEDLRPKFHPCFCFHIIVDFRENKSCTEFCGVLIIFQEIMKFQSFEFDLSDVNPVTSLPPTCLHLFVNFKGFVRETC